MRGTVDCGELLLYLQVASVGGLVDVHIRPRAQLVLHRDRGSKCGRFGGEQPGSHPGEGPGAVGRRAVAGYDQGKIQNVGHDLGPEGARGSASDQADLIPGRAGLAEVLESCADLESDPFEDRACQVRTAVVDGDSGEARTQVRIPLRGELAEQVGWNSIPSHPGCVHSPVDPVVAQVGPEGAAGPAVGSRPVLGDRPGIPQPSEDGRGGSSAGASRAWAPRARS